MERLDPSLLPPQMRMLVRAIGTPDALALLRLWGGQRRWVPADPALASPELRAALSPAALTALCGSQFGGHATDWPKLDKARLQSIHAAMRVDRAAGATANEIASRYGYTARRVRTIAPSSPDLQADLQADLFD